MIDLIPAKVANKVAKGQWTQEARDGQALKVIKDAMNNGSTYAKVYNVSEGFIDSLIKLGYLVYATDRYGDYCDNEPCGNVVEIQWDDYGVDEAKNQRKAR